MSKITFRFPDEESLQEFARAIKDKFLEVSLSELTITCKCEEAEAELAIKGFNAELVNNQVSLD